MPAPAFRSYTCPNTSIGVTTVLATEPAGATVGDLLIASVYTDGASRPVITRPAGWSFLIVASTLYETTTANLMTASTYWIRRGTTAPALTWNFSASVNVQIMVQAYSGAVPDGNPFSFTAQTRTEAGTAYPAVSGTTLTVDETVSVIGTNFAGTTAYAAPSGFTARNNLAINGDLNSSDIAAATPGAVSAAAHGTFGSGAAISFLVGIKSTMGVLPRRFQARRPAPFKPGNAR